jgi:magnesium-transporting ATPase (P-type)
MLDPGDMMLHAFASCHSLARLYKTTVKAGEPDFELIGDPLELKMFEMTHWHLLETRVGDTSVDPNSILAKHTLVCPPPPSHHSKTHHHHHHMHQPHLASSDDATKPHTLIVQGDRHGTSLAIIRQFTFSSALQRMAVIVGATDGVNHQGQLFFFAKVRVTQICIPSVHHPRLSLYPKAVSFLPC